mmetsp:Transcript_2714/g.5777  ORF Transcript_2714/g.5777 Transcript_2714/m.5777 type:complete len:227 (-) Transcript_2714:125-805(-)
MQHSVVAFALASMLSLSVATRLPCHVDERMARSVTLRWIDNLVIALGLCPWAYKARMSPSLQIQSAQSARSFTEAAMSASKELVESQMRNPTTMIVLPQHEYCAEVHCFSRLCAQIIRRVAQAHPEVDIIAFHPLRLDSGPGCSLAADDPAHFSVRSLLPTIQLLRRDELNQARFEWAATHKSPLPGALSLLNENKAKLRAIGNSELRQILSDCMHPIEQLEGRDP